MRALPDRWNPRVWLRDWLVAPSRIERMRRDASKARADEFARRKIEASLDGLLSPSAASPTMCGPMNLLAQGKPSEVVGRWGASR